MTTKKKRQVSESLKDAVKTLGKKGCWGPKVTFSKRGFPQYNQSTRYTYHEDPKDKSLLSTDNVKELTGFYADKMEKRLKIFYTESKRIEKKVQAVFDHLKELEVTLDKTDVDPKVVGRLLNPRTRKMSYQINVEATHPNMKLEGTMVISPASVKLSLHSPGITLKDPVIFMRYYRKLFVKNNIFVALVKGEKRPLYPAPTVAVYDKDIPF